MVTTDGTTTGQAIIQVVELSPNAISAGIPKEDPRGGKGVFIYQKSFQSTCMIILVAGWPTTYLLNSRMARVEVGIVPSAQDRK